MRKQQPPTREEIQPLACPFCDSNDWDESEVDGQLTVVCETCGALGPSATNFFNAVRLWNLRS